MEARPMETLRSMQKEIHRIRLLLGAMSGKKRKPILGKRDVEESNEV